MTESLLLFANTDRYYAYTTHEGDLILGERIDGVPRQLFTGRDVVEFLRTVSQTRDFLYCWRHKILANLYGEWRQIHKPPELDAALHHLAHLVGIPAGADPTALSWSNAEPDTPLRIRLQSAGLLVYEGVQHTLCDRVVSSALAFPAVAGFLAHPVHGSPKEKWLAPEWRIS